MSRMVRSVDVCPAGFCFITVTQIRMNKNSPLDQRYICPMGADGLHTNYKATGMNNDIREILC